jgi:acyl dehydratase
MTLQPRARVVAVVPKMAGTVVVCRSELLDDAGPVCTQLFTLFQVNESLHPMGEPARLNGDPGNPGDVADRPSLGELTESVAGDQSYRYAAASGDGYRIHTDEVFATGQGLDGIILHGMCTLAFAARAVVALAAGGDPARLAFLGARFSTPVRPGHTLTTTVSGSSAGGFTTTADDVPVLTRGRWAVQG